jgi:guanylate kinase
MRRALTIVLSGPGGVGKGTVARRLVEADPTLWLSRSWTTRPRRVDDGPSAYHFSTREEFEAHRDAGGFLEWNEFHGNLYGTPLPDAPPNRDVLLEIDVNGGRQVRAHDPDALLIFIDAPSVDEQRERLVRRGDSVELAEARIREGERERRDAQTLGYVFVINDDIDRAVAEIRRTIAARRRQGGGTTGRARKR